MRKRKMDEVELLCQELSKTRVYCAHCGHSVVMGSRDYKLCSWCNNMVFKNQKEEFKYRMNEKLIREKRRIKNEI